MPFDRAVVPANDMLRLLELGVKPFGTTLVSALAQAYPQYAGVDLAGLNPGFGQIMANMGSGNTDCAITGTMSGNTLGLHRVTSHIHSRPITWGLAVFGANKNTWDVLPLELKTLLSQELPRLEATIWRESERETAEGLACNTGTPQFPADARGSMLPVLTSATDERLRQQVFNSTVLPRWLARCGANCASVWNHTIGANQNPSMLRKP